MKQQPQRRQPQPREGLLMAALAFSFLGMGIDRS
jgi:hypothetical protein